MSGSQGLKGRVPSAQEAGSRRHVGIVVDDLAAAIEFFVELGLEPRGKGQVEGSWVERIIALDEVKVEFAMLRTPTATEKSSW